MLIISRVTHVTILCKYKELSLLRYYLSDCMYQHLLIIETAYAYAQLMVSTHLPARAAFTIILRVKQQFPYTL